MADMDNNWKEGRIGKPFVKGDPRCWRGGRPKVGLTLPGAIREALEETKHGDITHLRAIINNMIKIAESRGASNAVHAAEWLTDHGYGRAPMVIQLEKRETLIPMDRIPQDKLNLLEDIMGNLENDVIDAVAISVDDTSGTG